MTDLTADVEPGKPPPLVVVGLGGSAGSIPAFREFFRHVPSDSEMAYVVVVHLSPEHESRLADVLQGSTSLPVTQVSDHVKVEPNRVYVIPPNKSLAMSDGTLLLSEVTGFAERRAPIDIFFRTLADTHDSYAVCVVLSGSGSDGSMGLRRIKENNGLAIVQEPSEAQFAEMPRSSIATGLVDFVLPVAEMPQRMIAYRDQLLATPLGLGEPDDGEEHALIEIFTHLRVRTSHDFSNYKRPTVLRRIKRRQVVRGIPRLAEYARYLRDQPEESKALLRELLISVTNFFRDDATWDRVEETIVPQLFAGKDANDHIRAWVAGCATGEEAYTLAMLLAEYAGQLVSPPDIQIFATDLDEHAIAKARNGYYSAAETADISPERLRRHFVPDNEGFRVRRDLREIVLFAHHNVIKDPPFLHLDLVTCRNLLIYLNRTAQERIMSVLHFALDPGGFLVLGTSETVDGVSHLFSVVDKEHHIYESRAVPRVVAVTPNTTLTVATDLRIPSVSAIEPRPAAQPVRFGPLDLHQRLLEYYAPPSLVVDDEYNIVHVSEHAVRYVQFSSGEPSLNLLHVAVPELRVALRTALFQAAQRRTTVVVYAADHQEPESSSTLSLIVRPTLQAGDPARGYFLVLFDEAKNGAEVPPRAAAAPAEPSAPHLEEELLRIRAQMRTTVEQYEVQVEEAHAANEELQAINEELRSTAEELETSQEELQSVNEELQTVNQELKLKIDEISHTSNDMRNLMSSTEIGTIFVDRSMRVRLFTPRIRDIFNLIASDVGRPLLDIASKLRIDNLAADVEIVLERLQTVEREVQTHDGRWHLMRLLPYRTADDHIEGTVLTFVDVTDRKRADDTVRATEERQTFLLALSDRLRSLNEPQEIMQTAAEALGRHLGLHRVDYAEIEDDRSVEDIVVDDAATDARLTPDERSTLAAAGTGALVRMLLVGDGGHSAVFTAQNARPRQWQASEVHLVREVADRTWAAMERARAERALRASEEQFRTLFQTMDEGFALCELVRDAEGRAIDARYLEVNRAFESQSGLARADVVGRDMTGLFPGMEPSWLETFARVVETGEPARFEHHSAPADRWYDVRLYARGGKQFAVLFDDITERKNFEEALRASEDRHRIIVEGARDYAIITTDPQGLITTWSPGAEAAFGWSASEIVGQSLARTFTPEDRAAGEMEKERETARERGAAPDVRWHMCKDGSRVFIDGTTRVLQSRGGEVRGFLKIGQDVTERRRTDEALRDSESRLRVARDELELRVRERTQQLEDLSGQRQQLLARLVTATEEERRRIARELHDELGQHITALRMGLRDFEAESVPRMQAIVQRLDTTVDRLTLELRPQVLDHLGLHGAISQLAEAYADTSGLRVDVHLPTIDGERFSDAIETTIYRVLQEALTNVVKHAEANTASVILERDADALRVIIEDNGRSFDADGALAGTSARGRFGLIGMRERLALVGGSLAIESQPGTGTTIYVRVPLDEPKKSS